MDLEISDEFFDQTSGTTTTRLAQYYRGLQVKNAYATIAISKYGTADYATMHYFDEIDLPNYSFLSRIDDTDYLDSTAKSFWSEVSEDTLVKVMPLLLPVETEAPGEFVYHYTLAVSTPLNGPERYYDWNTGELLLVAGRMTDVYWNLDIIHRIFNETNGEFADVSEDCPGIGLVADNFQFCYDPVDGDCFFDDDGNLTIWEYAGNELLQIYRTGIDHADHTYDYGNMWRNIGTFFCHPNNPHCDLPLTFESGWMQGNDEDPAALYNLNEISRYFGSRFGFLRFTNVITSEDDLTDAIAWAATENDHNILFFGNSYSSDLVDGATPALSYDVAAHEYGHCYQYTCHYSTNEGLLTKAIMEGTADFFAAALRDNHIIERDLYVHGKETYGDPEQFNFTKLDELVQEEHAIGFVVSSALWQMRKNIEAYGDI
ncbi:MAG: hypothetical protein H6508_08935, partial [Calditrichaeota bacterium]|nr:hypothetical protein [Calditrichota bacterium]